MANRTHTWAPMPALELNNTSPSNSNHSEASAIPGGIGGYVHSYILIIVAAGAIVLIGLCLLPIGQRVRRHYHKKIDRAGDVAVAVTRPPRQDDSKCCWCCCWCILVYVLWKEVRRSLFHHLHQCLTITILEKEKNQRVQIMVYGFRFPPRAPLLLSFSCFGWSLLLASGLLLDYFAITDSDQLHMWLRPLDAGRHA